jgi:hypothetical protein
MEKAHNNYLYIFFEILNCVFEEKYCDCTVLEKIIHFYLQTQKNLEIQFYYEIAYGNTVMINVSYFFVLLKVIKETR